MRTFLIRIGFGYLVRKVFYYSGRLANWLNDGKVN